ncbi:hypothetical protein IW140_001581 [Coemansia sp. RSA 1813]|nr:hypothetical protein EV178_001658 [Coemansia sp. RSA 1646]KAJ1773420.1 hypothetical protein LPJ74_000673 [Coemansia sp. RSA 1843]KAJ2091326.1 hypothetical protein IW138_002025 [Coemansia sp. RSA 986]KAJ2216517.1 hypothetical protein EV179_001312 [Coemansia sp. RSA 487]KAJ2571401.1 hypothetical protein IW140_001581 [Coemansia sp. RSA 1813]
MSEIGNGSEHDDEFGMFGDENYDNEDFGDFGDFNELASKQTNEPVAVAEANGVDTIYKKQLGTDPETPSLVDSTLEQASALLDDSMPGRPWNETLEKCIRDVFKVPNTDSEIDEEQARLRDMRLDNDLFSSDSTNDFITDVLRRRTDCAETEPRLLRNLLLVSVASGNFDSQDIRYLLTPLCQIKALETQKMEQEKETPLFSIEEIQSIATDQEPSLDLIDGASLQTDTIDTLRHALLSIDTLITAKEQELTKKKDDIVTYNQVIQKLIAQASKLH